MNIKDMQQELFKLAKTIPKSKRIGLLKEIPETKMHKYLKELFQKMEPNCLVEITHGSSELGKDLVIVKKDNLSMDAIGVIVKCGDFKAKTLGDIDELKDKINKAKVSGSKKISEINSQIEQAINHPAELENIIQKLQIDKLFCVIVGNISKQARTRIEKEVKDKIGIEIFDLDWLADKFTEFYPQIYYEGEVIDFIRQKIEDLETKNCLYNRGKNLSEYFIEPLVEEISSPLQLDNQKLSLHDNVRMSFFKLKQIIYHSKRIILIGDPGSGKSGSVAKLAIEVFKQAEEMIFKNSCEDKIDIPIIIPANNILLYSSLDKLIDSYLQSNELKERFRISLLILDGLDESPVDKRSEIINKADLFANQLNCSVIITSRKIDIIEIPPKGFQKFELLHFQFSQALKLFKKIVSSPNTLNLLREGLEKIKSQIPMIPLSLMFMVELVEENKEIPASVTELYDRYYDMALGRWDAQKGISVLFEYIIKKRFISALAFDEYLNKDRLEITCDDFTNYLTEYSQKYRWDENKKKTFLNEIKRAGILDIRDVVMFKHRSILDYFAAYYIYYKRAEIPKLSDLLQKLYYSDLWSEVTFFYIGLHREITEDLIKKIFDYKDTDTFIFIKKMLVGQLLQAGWNSISDIKRLGLQKSISYAGKARCSFLSLAKTNSSNIPEIFADILLMGISEASYGSNFLIDEIKYTITQLNKETTSDNVYQLLLLLFAIRKLLNATELHKQVDNMLNLFPKLSHEEQARNLLIAMLIENEDKSIKKAIKNKLHKLIKKNPSLFEGLFPNKRKQLN